MFARAITLQPREGVRQSCGRNANPIKPVICKCFEIPSVRRLNVSSQEKGHASDRQIFQQIVEDFASHTERLTMHLLATPRIKKMEGVDLNSEDVGATGIGCQNLTYWICSE
jgi:hypothetical protein